MKRLELKYLILEEFKKGNIEDAFDVMKKFNIGFEEAVSALNRLVQEKKLSYK